jgi:hypothetical protein
VRLPLARPEGGVTAGAYLLDAAQATAALAALWIVDHWHRRNRYLAAQLQAAGGTDRWRTRCTHCGKPMRDAAAITGRRGVWHAEQAACAAAGVEAGRVRDAE